MEKKQRKSLSITDNYEFNRGNLSLSRTEVSLSEEFFNATTLLKSTSSPNEFVSFE